MNNTPHVGVDPDGGNWLSAIGGALFTGYTAGLISSGGILNPFDWSREDLNWAAAGFAAGGLLFGTMTDLKVSGGANKGIRGSDGLRNAWSLEWSDFALGIPRAMSSILSVLEPKLHIDNFIIDEKLKRQFELTFSQLDNINRFVRKINKINRNGGVTISSTILPKNNGYKPYFNEIFWAPYDAAVLKDGSIQSPGLLLIHELMHAHQLSKIGYEKFMSKKEVDDPLYTDLTEKYATKKTNQITRRLGLRNVSHRVGYKPGDFEYSIRTLDPLKADFVSFPKSCPFKIRVG
ncbi:MAG: hypothetical protein HRT61_07315 [Ekhidna sp.]|nr:hypothetical protein [Ekhidna sp.]